MKKTLLTFSIILLIASFAACGARIPSPKSAHSLTKSHFKSYGRKYKDTIFGKSKIREIDINRIEDQSRHIASIEAFLSFENGQLARVLVTAKKRPPFGWSVSSWEMLDLR